jgi:threonine/homoserine/homoserine lactone efflux protein
VIGFSIAAPVGPIGVLCIRRSLADGPLIGFFTGLGAATADAFYGAVAAFGLTIISNFLQKHQTALQIIGGVFLIYLGLKTFFAQPAAQAATPSGHASAFGSTFFLTLTNPTTIISFMVIFAAFGLSQRTNNYWSAALMTFGVFIGSAAWWLILSNSVSLFRTRITAIWMRQINRLAGATILAFAVIILLKLKFS